MRGLLILILAIGLLAICGVVYAQCSGNACTIPVEASAIVADQPVATATRSVGNVGKAITVPIRLAKKIADKKPVRSTLKAIAKVKPVRRVAAGVIRLACPRCRD
jgi:predicted pyridoxine 5'-phosphate oxidase superfamily flavin-nucleotide-binding protein